MFFCFLIILINSIVIITLPGTMKQEVYVQEQLEDQNHVLQQLKSLIKYQIINVNVLVYLHGKSEIDY